MPLNLLLIVAAVGLVMSLITLVVYAIDKSAAQRGARRVPENTLHLLALLGGWPGALLAQRWLRHKSIKVPFLILFWITAIINIAITALLLSPYGLQLLGLG